MNESQPQIDWERLEEQAQLYQVIDRARDEADDMILVRAEEDAPASTPLGGAVLTC